MRQIPFARPLIGEEEKAAVSTVLDGHMLVHGPKSKEFEEAFAAFTASPRAVSCASCTAALHLIYFELGLGAQDEVIVPAQTHVATAHAVELCGARPVFVDAEGETGNIDTSQIQAAITERTKAISVVHFLGMPVNMKRINEIAEKHDLFVVEDCALAVGTRLFGVHAGLIGDAGCFSFYPVKHITTAEGGMLISKDEAFCEKISRRKAFGLDRTVSERKVPGIYDVTMLGFNYRMNELEAALGVEQLRRAHGFIEKRRENFQALHKALKEVSELDVIYAEKPGFESSYYCLSVVLSPALAKKRFEIVSYLKAQGAGTSVYYPRPVPHFSYYREKYGYSENSFPEASRISYSSVALPVGPHLNEEDMQYIANKVKEAVLRSSP